jgi:hypothetical protein
LNTHLNSGVGFLFITHQLLGADGNKPESLSDNFTLRSTSRAGRSNKHDLWWSTGSTVSKSNTEHSSEVAGNILLLSVITVIVVNELVEGGVDLKLVDFPFAVKSLSTVLKSLLRRFSVFHAFVHFFLVLDNASNGGSLVDFQVNEFIRNDVHLLEGKGLNTSSWESLKHPALVSLLSILNFLLDSFNNDIIFNVFKVGKSFGNNLRVLVLGIVSNVSEDITSRNMLPLEVIRKRSRGFSATASRSSKDEHSLN